MQRLDSNHPESAESDLGPGQLGVTISVRSGDAPTGTTAVCWLDGEVDLATAPRLEHELALLVTLGVRDIVVDLQRVSFFGAVGVKALVATQRQLRGRGRLIVREPAPILTRILHACGLVDLLTVPSDGH